MIGFLSFAIAVHIRGLSYGASEQPRNDPNLCRCRKPSCLLLPHGTSEEGPWSQAHHAGRFGFFSLAIAYPKHFCRGPLRFDHTRVRMLQTPPPAQSECSLASSGDAL